MEQTRTQKNKVHALQLISWVIIGQTALIGAMAFHFWSELDNPMLSALMATMGAATLFLAIRLQYMAYEMKRDMVRQTRRFTHGETTQTVTRQPIHSPGRAVDAAAGSAELRIEPGAVCTRDEFPEAPGIAIHPAC